MYTMLIVDDEAPAIQAIEQSVNWSSLGIGRVLKADSGFSAQTLLCAEEVHVMLCDIEMPHMSGLTLIEWCREYSPRTETIILTCYASFSIAQKAISLGSVEYVVKPSAPQDLEAAVRRALALWEEKTSSRLAGQQWRESITLRRQQYFSDILGKNIACNPQTLQNYAVKYGVPTLPQELLHPMMLCTDSPSTQPDNEWRALLYGIANIAQELWQQYADSWSSLLHKDEDTLFLIGTGCKEGLSAESFGQHLKQLCTEYLHISVNIYYAGTCRCGELPAKFQQLEQQHQAHLHADAPIRQEHWADNWQKQIDEGCSDKVLRHITKLLQHDGPLTAAQAATRTQIERSLVQALEKELCMRQLDADFLRTGPSPTRQAADTESPDMQLLSWCQWALQRTDALLRGLKDETTLVQKMKEYIVLNIHEPLNRESIASSVYLNPDYAARLFKVNTGISLNDYIVHKRIELAKLLLQNSDIPIGELSQNLGYSSFSHFTKLFKASEGMMPSEYRKLHRQEE